MRVARPLAAGLLAGIIAFLLVYASGCGTDAVGVDECRDIEYARCEAARYCGLVEDTDKAAQACKRFYRDQCLHGMTSGERPGAPRVKDCVAVINAAGACAKNGQDALVDCFASSTAKLKDVETNLTDTCDAIREPEQVKACDFLSTPVEIEAGADVDEGGDADDASDAAVE
jgi:hypothetical protein